MIFVLILIYFQTSIMAYGVSYNTQAIYKTVQNVRKIDENEFRENEWVGSIRDSYSKRLEY